MTQPEQLTLPLEYHMYDRYTVELRKGAIGDMETQRSMTAKNVEDAANLIEGFRDSCLQRDSVTWQNDEVDNMGNLFGLAPGGVVYQISVVPPLTEVLSA
jgi:hypothetical protein